MISILTLSEQRCLLHGWCRFGMNIFTINAKTLIGANVFGVSKADLLSGQYSNPSVVTYTDWAPYPGFTIVPSMTQVCASPASRLSLVGRRILAGSGTGDAPVAVTGL